MTNNQQDALRLALEKIAKLYEGRPEASTAELAGLMYDARCIARAALSATIAAAQPADSQPSDADEHPLQCLHINQGSFDAAADAYEAEYIEAKCRKEYERTYHKVRAEMGYDDWKKAWVNGHRAALSPQAGEVVTVKSALAQQIESATAEMATWSDERKASVQLEGGAASAGKENT